MLQQFVGFAGDVALLFCFVLLPASLVLIFALSICAMYRRVKVRNFIERMEREQEWLSE